VELQLYTPYRAPTVGPPCFVPLRNRGSSLLRRRSHRNRLAVCLFGPCAVPSPRFLPLRFSSSGFEQLRPSLGLLRNLSPSLAAERLRRWPSLCSEGGVPNRGDWFRLCFPPKSYYFLHHQFPIPTSCTHILLSFSTHILFFAHILAHNSRHFFLLEG